MRACDFLMVVGLCDAVLACSSDYATVEPQCFFLQELNWTWQCVCTRSVYPYECGFQELPLGYCMTYDESTDVLSSGLCPYLPDFTGNISLDTKDIDITLKLSSIQTLNDLNEAMCGYLNREGLLCGKCRQNYGTALYSKTFQCVLCDKNTVWMWVLYLVLEIVPLTGLYFAVVIFNIRATSPPFTAFLFHHQFLSFLSTISVYRVLMGYHANQTLLKLTVAVMDMWNLDILRHLVPPFCVSSSLSNFQVHVIRLVSALYPLVLVVASYLLIELHARNCKVVVLLWRPFHRCFARLRRKWDPKSSNITAFSTFVTLKVFFHIINLFEPANIQFQPFLHNGGINALYIDPYLNLKSYVPMYLALAPIAILIIVIPISILCFYPVHLCRKATCSKLQLFKFFVNTFQGHYKDGTGGTHDYRAVSSIVLILRVLASIALYPVTSRSGDGSRSLPVVLVHMFIMISLFYAIAQPCKEKYMNNLESILYAFTGMSFLFIINVNINPRAEGKSLKAPMADLFLIIQLLPSLVLLVKVIHKIAVKIRAGHFPSDESSTNSLPDRIVHPNKYTPLI